MKKILKTKQLEFDKSGFLIDLVEHESGKLYIEITHRILDADNVAETIKINPSVLPDILRVLHSYQAFLPKESKPTYNLLTESDQDEVQSRYLKGVPIKDIAMQFAQTKELIEMILRNRGIEIVDNSLPKKRFWRRKSRRRSR